MEWVAPQPHLFVQARRHRDNSWSGHPLIPSWVDISDVGLDRFFTRPDVAAQCWEWMQQEMRSDHASTDDYWFVDPSAGDGVFYQLLPEGRRSLCATSQKSATFAAMESSSGETTRRQAPTPISLRHQHRRCDV